MPRIYDVSDATPTLNLWCAAIAAAANECTPATTDNPAPDISGLWGRTGRAMECRNPQEEPGLRSETNLKGSRSEVSPPDIDRAKSNPGNEVPRMLQWQITATETAGSYTGGGPGSAHEHYTKIEYKGVAPDGTHRFTYIATRSIKSGEAHVATDMYGTIIVARNASRQVTQLTTVVDGCDGRDADLPRAFKEVSIWRPTATPT
ncbi:MAG: hypothetical protein EB059_05910 [Alphaproteobacteria bacterium]|nr:hypothetical protein [Alphaproteobacteria bacterium]